MERGLVFSVAEIREKEGLTFTETVPVEDFAQEASGLSGSCAVRLEFSVGGQSVLMEGTLQGRWLLTCSRCLAEHPQTFESRLEETYPLSRQTIDAGEELRQSLLLSLPAKPLCRPDCRGLCPRCGKNLNEGPCACASPITR